MENALHSRAAAYRNLYRATPVKQKEEKVTEYDRKTIALVNSGWQSFWERRGIKPPRVSQKKLLCYDLPGSKLSTNPTA